MYIHLCKIQKLLSLYSYVIDVVNISKTTLCPFNAFYFISECWFVAFNGISIYLLSNLYFLLFLADAELYKRQLFRKKQCAMLGNMFLPPQKKATSFPTKCNM